jgi:hypothetical protein
MKSSLVDLNTMAPPTDHDLMTDHNDTIASAEWHHGSVKWYHHLVSPLQYLTHLSEHKFPSPDIFISIKPSVPLQDILNLRISAVPLNLDPLLLPDCLSSLVLLPGVFNLEDFLQPLKKPCLRKCIHLLHSTSFPDLRQEDSMCLITRIPSLLPSRSSNREESLFKANYHLDSLLESIAPQL